MFRNNNWKHAHYPPGHEKKVSLKSVRQNGPNAEQRHSGDSKTDEPNKIEQIFFLPGLDAVLVQNSEISCRCGISSELLKLFHARVRARLFGVLTTSTLCTCMLASWVFSSPHVFLFFFAAALECAKYGKLFAAQKNECVRFWRHTGGIPGNVWQ